MSVVLLEVPIIKEMSVYVILHVAKWGFQKNKCIKNIWHILFCDLLTIWMFSIFECRNKALFSKLYLSIIIINSWFSSVTLKNLSLANQEQYYCVYHNRSATILLY